MTLGYAQPLARALRTHGFIVCGIKGLSAVLLGWSHSQVGGLADVVTSLAKAHLSTGTLAEVVLPK